MQHSSAAVEFLFPDTFEILPLNYRKFIRRPIYRYSFIDKILEDGAEKADKITSKKVNEMKKIIGF